MRTIIAGSRDIDTYIWLEAAIAASGFGDQISTVISGGAKGVDSLGEWYAIQYGIPLEIHKADWAKYGRGAGPIRNQEMAEIADALIALWDGESRGTADMINKARLHNLKVYVHTV